MYTYSEAKGTKNLVWVFYSAYASIFTSICRSLTLSRTAAQFIPLNDYDAPSSPSRFKFTIVPNFMPFSVFVYSICILMHDTIEFGNVEHLFAKHGEEWGMKRCQKSNWFSLNESGGGGERGSDAMRYSPVASQCNHNMWMPNICHERRTKKIYIYTDFLLIESMCRVHS